MILGKTLMNTNVPDSLKKEKKTNVHHESLNMLIISPVRYAQYETWQNVETVWKIQEQRILLEIKLYKIFRCMK